MATEISAYSFGRITIRGDTYTSDVIIYPGRVNPSWWRKEGHLLQPVDLEEVVTARPSVVIIGTGASGVMKVPHETVRFLESKGITVHVARTAEAVELYNTTPKDKPVVAALHLTC
jgi:hypothetical protein